MNERFQFPYLFEKQKHEADVTALPYEGGVIYLIRPRSKQHCDRFGEEISISIFNEPTRGLGYSIPETYDLHHDLFVKALYYDLQKVVG